MVRAIFTTGTPLCARTSAAKRASSLDFSRTEAITPVSSIQARTSCFVMRILPLPQSSLAWFHPSFPGKPDPFVALLILKSENDAARIAKAFLGDGRIICSGRWVENWLFYHH